jgi:hypothetical protein
MPTIENWSIGFDEYDPYKAPELQIPMLYGTVTGHKKIKDGTNIRTSRITNVEGRIITTYSGSIYTLGQVSEDYVKWCEENKASTREQLEGPNPIKWKE